MGLGVYAADLNERTAPEEPDWIVDVSTLDLTPQKFEVGTPYVLYNVGSELFYYRGNAWTTQATGSDSNTLPMRFVLPSGKTLDDKALYLRNFDDRSNEMKWRTAFITSDGKVNGVYGDNTAAMFIDNNDGTAALMWVEAKEGENNVYRLSISESNTNAKPDGMYVGIDPYGPGVEGGLDGTCIMPKLSEDANVDWIFLALPSEMTNYFKLLDIYNKSEELKKLIEKAEAQGGVNISAAVAAYNNPDATLEELQDAYDALEKSMKDNTFSGFTPGTVLNVSGLINNPTFDGNDLTGWDGSGWGAYNGKENAERYQMTFDTYQDIEGLKAGVYVAGVNAFYRAGNSDSAYENYKAQNENSKNAKFYITAGDETFTADVVSPFEGAPTSGQGRGTESNVKDEETGITYYIPNNMDAAEYYMHSLGLYKNSIFFETAANQMRIGMKKDVTIEGDWVICDDFSLIYCGEGAQAYQAYVEYYKTLFPDYRALRVDAEDPFTNTSGLNVSDCVLNDFDAVSVSATDEASALAAIEALDKAFEPVRENVSLWAEFLATAKKAAAIGDDTGLDQTEEVVAEVGDWGKYLAAEEWNAHDMTNEQLRAKIDDMNAKIKEAKNHPIHEGYETPCTDLLVNADFEEGQKGWTREAASGGNVNTGGTATNTCYEAWNNANFDIYQIVEDAPEGVYRIEVQGFYRYLRGENAWNAYQAQSDETPYVKPGGSPVFVYMNHKSTPFKNVFDEQVPNGELYTTGRDNDPYVDPNGEFWYTNNMANSAEAFSKGMYKQSAYGIIRAGQDMRIGVKGVSNQGGDSWVIWDNFRLFNCGKDRDALNNVLPEEIEKATSMLTNEDGTDKKMGKDIREALLKAIADANAALGTTGEAMFDALNDLFEAEENVDASVELFNKLATANDGLMKALETYGDSDAAPEAGELYQTILLGLEEFKYNDSDVPGLMKQIKEMMTKLRMPAGYENASELNPVDFTDVIENPEYDSNGDGIASSDGWDGTAVGTNEEYLNAEIFNTETFDHYQEILGLPSGAYRVSVKAFYRAGYAADDYAAYNENSESNNNAVLYAKGASTQSVPLIRLATLASDYHADETDWAEVAEGSGLYVPNTMSTASVLFEEEDDALINSVMVYVGASGLRIGLKKDVGVDHDWCLFDNWTLEYLGKDVKIPVEGDVNNDQVVDVADISNIITIMASDPTNLVGDVNKDGVVDVADISKVITIMAENARAMKTIEE